MGKVKNEGRQFYKKTIVANSPSKPIVANQTSSSFKFKPVENVIKKSTPQPPATRDSVKQANTKKSKLQQRKDNLMKKITIMQPAAKKRKQQKKKIKLQKKSVARVATLSDLTSLKNALPSLNDSLPSLNSLFMLKINAELKTGVPQFDNKLKVDEDKANEIDKGCEDETQEKGVYEAIRLSAKATV